MTQLWQLKNLTDGAELSEAKPLPENCGRIFGLSGISEKLSDLSWLGPSYSDMGWFKVEGVAGSALESTEGELAWEKAKKLLRTSDWSMLPDVPRTSEEKALWVEYRRKLREIRSDSSFPDMVWPSKPE